MTQKFNKRVTVSLPYDLDLEFRSLASRKFKFEKGWYSKAVADALTMWIKCNESPLLQEGLIKFSRFAGRTIWNSLKENCDNNLKINSNQEALNHVFNYFNNEFPYILDLNYKIYDQAQRICIYCPCITENENFMMEDFIFKCLQPISFASIAGIEDITGNKYRVSNVEMGSLNRIYFKKIL